MVTVQSKKRGSMYVWESSNRSKNWRRTFAMAFYPVNKPVVKGHGWVEFRDAASSNIGGQVRVSHVLHKTYIYVEIHATLPYGGTSGKQFKLSQRKQALAAYNTLVKQVRKARTIAGITGVIKRRKKMKGWR